MWYHRGTRVYRFKAAVYLYRTSVHSCDEKRPQYIHSYYSQTLPMYLQCILHYENSSLIIPDHSTCIGRVYTPASYPYLYNLIYLTPILHHSGTLTRRRVSNVSPPSKPSFDIKYEIRDGAYRYWCTTYDMLYSTGSPCAPRPFSAGFLSSGMSSSVQYLGCRNAAMPQYGACIE